MIWPYTIHILLALPLNLCMKHLYWGFDTNITTRYMWICWVWLWSFSVIWRGSSIPSSDALCPTIMSSDNVFIHHHCAAIVCHGWVRASAYHCLQCKSFQSSVHCSTNQVFLLVTVLHKVSRLSQPISYLVFYSCVLSCLLTAWIPSITFIFYLNKKPFSVLIYDVYQTFFYLFFTAAILLFAWLMSFYVPLV